MRLGFSLISGSLFGAGLMLSGMTDTAKVQGFLDIFGAWDPSLAFVMGGALLPMAIAWRLTQGRAPAAGGSFPAPPQKQLDRRLFLGAVLFGTGWGLAGFCPGPAMASLSYNGWQGVLFLAAMICGMMAAPGLSRHLDRRAANA
ncbi:membrane protein [Leisingera sp. ANG-Vp]|nr:membrane protein [Leisingera sp. ANG-Vp]